MGAAALPKHQPEAQWPLGGGGHEIDGFADTREPSGPGAAASV